MLQLHTNQNYYFRYNIPKEYQLFFNTKEILKSLRTKNKQQAESLCANSTREIEYIFYLLRSNMLTDNDIIRIIDDYKKGTVEKTNKLFARLPDIQDLNKLIDFEEQRNILKNMFVTEDFTKVLEFKESALEEYGLRSSDIEIYKNSKSVADITKGLLDKFNIENYSKDDFNKLAEEVTATKIGLLDYLESLLKGEVTITDPYGMNSYITKSIGNVSSIVTKIAHKDNAIGITIGKCWEDFITQKRTLEKRASSTIKQYESSRNYLSLFYSDDTDIGVFTKKIFRDLLVMYTQLPKYTFNNHSYKNMSIQELMDLKVEKLNSKTINAKFINYKELFAFLVYQEIISENVVDVKTLAENDSDKVQYTEDDIKKIFESNLDDSIKNLCKIALYTGMRIGEILLLKTHNIDLIEDIACIAIIKGDTRTKTKNAVRNIPIHEKIKDLIEQCKQASSNNYLFYNGTETNEDKIVQVETKRINKELNKIIATPTKTFHSLRKNFSTKLYETSADKESFIKVLMGHSVRGNITLSIYGKADLRELLNMVNKIDYHCI